MKSGRSPSVLWLGRSALVAGAVCLALAILSPPAGANYAAITAEARCDRSVAFTASSAEGTTTESKSNPRVTVAFRPAGSGDDAWVDVESGALDPPGSFTLSGSFTLPVDVNSVELRVTPEADWGDGTRPGNPRFTTASIPPGCAEAPLVVSMTSDCDAGGVALGIRNVGSEQEQAEMSVDRVPVRTMDIPADGSVQMLIPVLSGDSALVRVSAGDFVVTQHSIRSECSRDTPEANILERCPSHRAVVSVSSNGPSKTVVEIRVDGTIVHKSTVTEVENFRRTIELPGKGAVPVAVDLDGQVASVAMIGGCDSPVVGAVSCGANTGRPCTAPVRENELPPPPPPPPSISVDLGNGSLPHTGPSHEAIALAVSGVLLAMGGSVLIAEQRRRPATTLLSSSVEMYRRRWWEDR